MGVDFTALDDPYHLDHERGVVLELQPESYLAAALRQVERAGIEAANVLRDFDRARDDRDVTS